MNEALRLHYLEQLGVTSWMPRLPLVGALPSEYVELELPIEPSLATHHGHHPQIQAQSQAVAQPKPIVGLSPETDQSVQAPSPIAAVLNRTTVGSASLIELAQEEKALSSRVPQRLRLGLVRLPEPAPLIIANITDEQWPEHQIMPLLASALRFMGLPENGWSMPFEWPFRSNTGSVSDEAFLMILHSLLTGARLQCQSHQPCWWFGDLPELIAQDHQLLNIQLHHPISVNQLLHNGQHKMALLQQLITLKNSVT
ncbi:hypothetical protein SAMN02745127_00582 [Oceanospirillum multiglobuliferum]|uniref:Uncharacterized protein n=1 Tax=Oceanospirillum multiglobuliferum TaxID=64969 RepID=A0A1T4LY77_9GAMM|nr:hypothetical protein [Oceanospirillum multiglobuliferum]OPX56313.1 hypothetical protein BTE48_04910 [Oceanospirillum multiglobuliferum]SJZ59627.1 hypothetical protein SAMN02745127_00582 [Oceanospirillum multiglobuliferum]